MSRRRNIGIAGAIVGAASAGVAAASLAKRYAVGRIRLRPDLAANEPFGELTARPVDLTTSDGITIHAEIDGPESDLTIVLCHGYCLTSESWHYQWRMLRERYRVVVWDQRFHGKSSRADDADCSIDRLGEDLGQVLDELVPGPCVIIGHSMGGMTIMALADSRPELFGDRIKGAALISTSAGRLAELSLGLPALVSKVVHKAVGPTVSVMRRRSALIDRGREVGTDLSFLAMRYLGFGDSSAVSPTVIDFAESMIRSTPSRVIADFYPALMSHDKLKALDVLNKVPTAIIVGESDWLTPPDHSRSIAAAMSTATLTTVPGTSHLVQLERPGAVNEALAELIDRVERGEP